MIHRRHGCQTTDVIVHIPQYTPVSGHANQETQPRMRHGTEAAPMFGQYLDPLIQAHQIRIHGAIPWITSVMPSPWTLLWGVFLTRVVGPDLNRW